MRRASHVEIIKVAFLRKIYPKRPLTYSKRKFSCDVVILFCLPFNNEDPAEIEKQSPVLITSRIQTRMVSVCINVGAKYFEESLWDMNKNRRRMDTKLFSCG